VDDDEHIRAQVRAILEKDGYAVKSFETVVVKRVAQNHGLRLRVASELDQGATFTVQFPVAGSRGAAEPQRRE
jgi:DNA-binding response OmpR family regulator